jgi:hypothetical protein
MSLSSALGFGVPEAFIALGTAALTFDQLQDFVEEHKDVQYIQDLDVGLRVLTAGGMAAAAGMAVIRDGSPQVGLAKVAGAAVSGAILAKIMESVLNISWNTTTGSKSSTEIADENRKIGLFSRADVLAAAAKADADGGSHRTFWEELCHYTGAGTLLYAAAVMGKFFVNSYRIVEPGASPVASKVRAPKITITKGARTVKLKPEVVEKLKEIAARATEQIKNHQAYLDRKVLIKRALKGRIKK